MEQIEAYEHWIVTDWLAQWLESYGEMVHFNIYGLTVWGRCTTGQSVYLDYVIQQIYQDLQRKN